MLIYHLLLMQYNCIFSKNSLCYFYYLRSIYNITTTNCYSAISDYKNKCIIIRTSRTAKVLEQFMHLLIKPFFKLEIRVYQLYLIKTFMQSANVIHLFYNSNVY